MNLKLDLPTKIVETYNLIEHVYSAPFNIEKNEFVNGFLVVDQLYIYTFIEDKLTNEQRKTMTGTSQVCTLNDYPIHMIEGDEVNFKITTASDFIIAENIIKGSEDND